MLPTTCLALVLTRKGNGMKPLGAKPLVMSVFVVALNISFCVRLAAPVYIPVCVCQCLLGIHVQPQYCLGLRI